MIPANSVLIALAGQGKTRGTVAINRISLTTNQSIAAMIFSKELSQNLFFAISKTDMRKSVGCLLEMVQEED